jgi:hypothetical protein
LSASAANVEHSLQTVDADGDTYEILGSNTVAGVRNLKQAEAAERASLLDVTAYDISLDLTDGAGYPGERVFRSVTEVRFTCREPGVGTFIEVAAESVRSATLNGDAVDVSGWSAEGGLTVPRLAAENVLVIDADYLYSSTGQGCTARSTRSTRRSTSTASSRRPTRSACSPASTSPT